MDAKAAIAVSFALVAGSCSEGEHSGGGAVYVVAESRVASVPVDRAAARALAESTPRHVFRGSSKGKPFGFIAIFGRAARSMQVGLVITEEGDEGSRVVYADELDSAPATRFAVGVVRPPPNASWPRACRTYVLRFSSSAGELARGRALVPGCAKAIEDLRGGAIFHVGKGGPPLYSFEGSLGAYKRKVGARPLLKAPLGRAPFFLGWKAAFRGPAKASSLRVRIAEAHSGRIAAEDDLPLDPTWDSFAGGWQIPGEPSWPKAGLRYELNVYVPRPGAPRAEVGSIGAPLVAADVLARGTVVVAEVTGPGPAAAK